MCVFFHEFFVLFSKNLRFRSPCPFLVVTFFSTIQQLFASGLHTDDHFFTSDGNGGAGGLPSGSMHLVASSRRESRSGDMYGGLGSARKGSKGVFGNRVNASEQARDVERMNAEVCHVVICTPSLCKE